MREPLEIVGLLAAGVFPLLAYLAVGLRLLGPLGIASRGTERLALAFVFGTGCASLAILLLRAVDVPVPVWATAVCVAAVWPWRESLAALKEATARKDGLVPTVGPRWPKFADFLTGTLGLLVLLAALGPETYWDGFEYHLPLVMAWTEGPIRALPALLDAEFRAGIDLLYVPAVTSGYEDAAAAVSAAFAVCLAALVRAEVARRATPGAASLAGLFTLLAPLVVDGATSTYVDLGMGAYGFLALLFADRWNRKGDSGALWASAICLGFAVNAKLHTAMLVPTVLIVVLAGGRCPTGWMLATRAAIVAALTLPWFVKVTLTTGNPLFPFLGEWLGFGAMHPRILEFRRERLLANYDVARNLSGIAQYLASLTFGRNVHVSGLLGPLPLALAPLAWGAFGPVSRSTRVLLACCSLLVLLLFLEMPAARFGAPLWPLLAVAAGVGGARLAASGRISQRILAVGLFLVAAHLSVTLGVRIVTRIPALAQPTAYERRVFPDQDNLRRIVSISEPVVAIPMGAVSWMPKPVYNLLWERNGELFFFNNQSPDRTFEILKRRGVRTLVLDVPAPPPGDGSVGHAIVDSWLSDGRAELDTRIPRLAERADRVWIVVRLIWEQGPASGGQPAADNPGGRNPSER